MPLQDNQSSCRLISPEEARKRANKSRSAMYRDIRAGKFPAPVQNGGRIAFHEHEVVAWIASRPRVSYAPAT